MIRYFWFAFVFIFFITGCKKEEERDFVSTGEIIDLQPKRVTIEGAVNHMPGSVIQHGHCYSTSKNPREETS